MNVGDVLERSAHVERINLVMYAGASGDFNPIHWNETFAKAVGLPDVIAHGMYTQAQLGTLLVELAGGDPGRILSFSLRFSAPVVVADDGGAELDLRAEVVAVEEGVASVSMTARSAGVDVVKDAVATLRVA
ncbi:MAG: MaoC/PaaZ C-terminal domain-containing protein [Candidatus Nanopelagicales bacterium]|jgi:acyl dehydratase|nr:MaoC/PaaZ C-terminal domain-containing protein [Actinomycetota bacterium]HNL51460.1 MaoC/PaaZ C-terminal domain-containing protein [Actinomycetota bacterium]HNO15387.1 MaoC/PaaZ C-terminal domain-containing protein [Actinomycetota bacterium]HRY10613.1 MaoC/PaaZ C-terminal domain-containing protein [Candidatus Nanopelagicales bacterium]HUM86369.1 MaoC/PaaZ C-terminal domain-containing protein [Actinomycetota bacterium]